MRGFTVIHISYPNTLCSSSELRIDKDHCIFIKSICKQCCSEKVIGDQLKALEDPLR